MRESYSITARICLCLKQAAQSSKIVVRYIKHSQCINQSLALLSWWLWNIQFYCRKKRLAIQSFHLPVLSVWDLLLHIDTQYYSQASYLFCITKWTIPYLKGLSVICVLLSIKQYLLLQIPDCWQSLLRNLNKVTSII